MRKQLLAVVLFSLSQIAFGAPTEVTIRRAAGDMATEFKNHKLAPSPNPIPLPQKSLTDSDRRILDQANSMFDRNNSLSIVMVEKGQLVFEKYKAPSGPQVPNFSWSMSKSLTGNTIGAMLCSGKIADLNQPAQSYAPELKGTVYGEATVKNLLTMSSGVKDAIGVDAMIFKTKDCKPGFDCDDWQLQRSQLLSGIELLKAFPERDTSWGRPIASGSRFAYTGVDTTALRVVADSTGGFIENFNQHIWLNAGTESPGYWLLEKDNRVIAAAGFSASSRDWARLAMLTIKQAKFNDCIGNYVKEATREHLSNSTRRVGAAFKGYGYQTWIADFGPRNSYWWAGYGGQRVGVDLATERILVVTSWREDYMDEIYKLFAQWQRQ